MHTNTVTISMRNHLTPTMVGGVCVAVTGVLLAFYMYFLSMSVVDVVFRKEAHQESRDLESEIATLEAAYIEAQHKVSEHIASAELLSETSEKIFIERAPQTLVFTNNR